MELVESTKNTDYTMMEISMDVFEVSKSLLDVMIIIQKRLPSKKTYKKIKIIEKKMNRLFHDVIRHGDTRYNDSIILGVAYLLMSWIYEKIVEEELSQDYMQIYLIRCLELIKGKELDRTVILLAIRALNNLGNIYFKIDQPEDSIPIFEEAIQLYLMYTEKKDVYPVPFNVLTIIGFEENLNCKYLLEEMYIMILTRLIIASDVVGETDERIPVLYKLEYFNQHLKHVPLIIGSIDFVIQIASISEYFLSHNNFTGARNCLAAAYWMLKRFHSKAFTEEGNTEKFLGENAFIRSAYENINKKLGKYWGRYGLALLRSSVERLSQSQEEDKSFETSNLKLGSPTKFNEQLDASTLLANIGEELKTCDMITDKYLTHYADAQDVYTRTLYWLNKAQTFYTLEKHKIEYITIVQDVSKVRKYFAYYEQDLETQMKLHSMRILDLERISKVLNKRNNRDYNIRKQICIELAVIYSILLDLATKIKQKNTIPSILNPDYLANHSMLNFQLYLT